MASTNPKNQTLFDDEISFLDLIKFIRKNHKTILSFVLLGALLGPGYVKFYEPNYEVKIIIKPAKFNGIFINDPKIIVSEANLKTYFSNKVKLECNAKFHEGEDDLTFLNAVKISQTKDSNLLELSLKSKNKEFASRCINSMADDLTAKQNSLLEDLMELKKRDISILEDRIKTSEKLKEALEKNIYLLNKIKKSDLLTEIYSKDLLSNLNAEIYSSYIQINKLKLEIAQPQSNYSFTTSPAYVIKDSFISVKLGILIGLIFGFILGSIISYIRQIIFNLGMKN